MSVRHPFALRRSVLCFAVLAIGTACSTTSVPVPTRLALMTHAAFFSQETNQNPALDPQVFVRDASAPEATGPQNIHHVAGVRNALLTDPSTSPIYNANGALLDGFTLGSWLGARGDVTIASTGTGGSTIMVTMSGLRPAGVYSLFENHFDQTPVGFTPLDGTGTSNTVTADAQGTARITVAAPDVPTHDHAVLVVYHSDGMAHGMERGPIGVTAHHQLIVRIPR